MLHRPDTVFISEAFEKHRTARQHEQPGAASTDSTPLVPGDVVSRRREVMAQAREKQEKHQAEVQERIRLVIAGNLVEDLGWDYALNLGTDRLREWVAA